MTRPLALLLVLTAVVSAPLTADGLVMITDNTGAPCPQPCPLGSLLDHPVTGVSGSVRINDKIFENWRGFTSVPFGPGALAVLPNLMTLAE